MGGHHACNETPPSLILTPRLVPFSRPPGDADARNGAPRSVPLMELLISLDQGSLVDELQAEREVRARSERDRSKIGTRSERDWRAFPHRGPPCRPPRRPSRSRPPGRVPPIAPLLIPDDHPECAPHHQVDLDLPALTAAASGELPPSEAVAAKASAATQLLGAHRAKIAEELAARRKLILLLAGSIESQHEQCATLTKALASCESMLATAARAAAL